MHNKIVLSISMLILITLAVTVIGCVGGAYSLADMNDPRIVSRCDDARYYIGANGYLYNDSDSVITAVHYYRDTTNPLLRNSEVYRVNPHKRYKVIIRDRDDTFQISAADGKLYILNVRVLGIADNKEEMKLLRRVQRPRGYKR